jgi:hypothetical protein
LFDGFQQHLPGRAAAPGRRLMQLPVQAPGNIEACPDELRPFHGNYSQDRFK